MKLLVSLFLFALFTAAHLELRADVSRKDLWIEALVADESGNSRQSLEAATKLLSGTAENPLEYVLAAELYARALVKAEQSGKRRYLRVEALREALKNAPDEPAKALLEVKLAWEYAELAESSYSRSSGKSDSTAALPVNLEEWDASQFRRAAVEHYDVVLSKYASALQKTPIDALKAPEILCKEDREKVFPGRRKGEKRKLLKDVSFEILNLNSASAAEFPTLYDFIAHDAGKFYEVLSGQVLGQEKEVLPDSETLLASPKEFLERVEAEAARKSDYKWRALRILCERTRFHLSDTDSSALARATLERIFFVQKEFRESVPEELDALFEFIGSYENAWLPRVSHERQNIKHRLSRKQGLPLGFEAALTRFIADYESLPVAAEAVEILARFYIANGREVEAESLLKKAIAAHGNCVNAEGCKQLLEQLESPVLWPLVLPRNWVSSEPVDFHVVAKNVSQIRLRAVAVDWRKYFRGELGQFVRKFGAGALVADKVSELHVPLNAEKNFRETVYRESIPAGFLSPGFYLVFVAYNDEAFERHPLPVWVSDLAVVTEAGYACAGAHSGREGFELRVVNAVTGVPLEGAKVFVREKKHSVGDWVDTPAGKTDKLGEAIVPGVAPDCGSILVVEAKLPRKERHEHRPSEYFKPVLESQEDLRPSFVGNPEAAQSGDDAYETHVTAIERIGSIYDPSSIGVSTAKPVELAVFADRDFLRPGETLAFKGIVFREQGGGHPAPELFVGKKIAVSLKCLKNGRFEEMVKTEPVSNEFASFSGSLKIPEDADCGEWLLVAECVEGKHISSNTKIYVGENWRTAPKLEILKADFPQRLGGKVVAKIAGRAPDGTALAGTHVHWRVREKRVGVKADCAHGDGVLDENGSLEISWETEPRELWTAENEGTVPESSLFTEFNVSAEMALPDGKILSAEKELAFGNRNFNLIAGHRNWSLGEPVPLFYYRRAAGEKIELVTETHFEREAAEKTPNSRPVPVKLEVVRLTRAQHYSFWENIFSAEALSVEKGSETPSLVLPADKWVPGRYRILATAQDDFGEPVRTETRLDILEGENKKLSDGLEFFAQLREYRLNVGDTAEILWGSPSEEASVFVEVHVPGIAEVQRFYVQSNRELKIIRIPITSQMEGKYVCISLSQMSLGRFYTRNFVFGVRYQKQIAIEVLDCNSFPEAGAPETWRFKLTRPDGKPAADAEIAVALYDITGEGVLYPQEAEANWKEEAERLVPMLDYRLRRRGLFSSSSAVHFYHFAKEPSRSLRSFRFPEWTYAFSGEPRKDAFKSFNKGWETKKTRIKITEDLLLMAAARASRREVEEITDWEDKRPFSRPLPPEFGLKDYFKPVFFHPHLRSDANGIVSVEFIVPGHDARRRLRLFAHDKALNFGLIQRSDIRVKKNEANSEAP